MEKTAVYYCCNKTFSELGGLASHQRSKRCTLNKAKPSTSQCHLCKGDFGPGGLIPHLKQCENQRREHAHLRPAGRYADAVKKPAVTVLSPPDASTTRDVEPETGRVGKGEGGVMGDDEPNGHGVVVSIDTLVHSQGVGMLHGALPDDDVVDLELE